MAAGTKTKHHTPTRKKLPNDRKSVIHKFAVGGHEGYITAGLYDDGSLGEIFIVMSKKGSVVSGVMDSFATAISIALQYGVPLEVFADKFIGSRFEPLGITGFAEIPEASSVVDYLFRWLLLRFAKDGNAATVKAEPVNGPVNGEQHVGSEAPPPKTE